MSTETSCHFGHLLQVSQKFLSSLILFTFFHDFIHVYSPGAGVDNPWGRNVYVNRNISSLQSFVASFKKISLTSDFKHFFFFIILYMYITPGQGQTAPGDKVLMSTKTSSHFIHLLQVSLKSLQSLILYNCFIYLIPVYSPRAGAHIPQGQSFDVSKNVLPLRLFVTSSKQCL